MDSAHLPRLRRDLQAASGADESHGGLVTGAGDLESRRATGVGKRAVREKRAAPDGGKLLAAAGGELVREAADRPSAGIQQPRLARKGLPPVQHAHEVVARATKTGSGDDGDFAPHPVQLGEVFAHAASKLCGVELRLDSDAPRDKVQAPGEAKNGGKLRCSNCGLAHIDAGEFVFDVGGESQSDFLPFSYSRIARSDPADSAGVPDHRRCSGGRGQWHYSRPRSRCLMLTATPGCSRSREASRCTIATDRCFPPVHPMAIVACLLFSR